jgi:hypothetical protein
VRANITAMILLVGASSCATDGFNGRVGNYDVAAEQSRDTAILMNVVRASYGEPLSFLQLSKVSGSTSANGSLGFPGIVSAPHSPVTVTGAMQTSFYEATNFEVSPTETKDFYRGILNEVDPHTLELFVQQGVPREVLFYVFVDKVLEERGGRRLELRNDPLDPTFPAFQRAVHLAVDYGLASEPRPSAGAAVTGPLTTKGKQEQKDWQLCFDRKRADAKASFNGNSPVCGSGQVSADDRSVSFVGQDGQKVRLTTVPRSVFSIFKYLGRVLAAGEAGQISLYTPDAVDRPPLMDPNLFTITGASGAPCFISVEYHGRSYCVPLTGATNTKRIIGLLTQLIALNTSLADIPVTPTVRIVQ